MKPLIAFFLVFFAVAAVMCSVWWLGGFNFDHRSPDVAFGYAVTLFISATCGVFAAVVSHD